MDRIIIEIHNNIGDKDGQQTRGNYFHVFASDKPPINVEIL